MNQILATVAFATLISCNTTNKTTMQTPPGSANSQEGFVSLFDGKTTSGWHSYGKTAAGKVWKAENGILHFDAASKKSAPTEGGDLVTNEEFENFHLKLDWKISPKGNSGVVFYIKEGPQFQEMWHTGPEMQVLDNGTSAIAGHPDAKITSHRAGDLYDLMVAKEVVKPVGEWNTAEIIANKGKLDFYLNGQHTLSTTMWDENWKAMIAKSKFKDMPGFGKYTKGRIGLQDHGDEVWYRNILIKKL
jgi:hypothetical protein